MPYAHGVIDGIDHVQIAAPRGCEEAARAFWGGVLGLAELDKPPLLAARGGAWFAAGGQAVHVGVEEPFSPARKAHPALRCADLNAAAARLAAAGAPVLWADDIPGLRRFFTEDPFGNRIELVAESPLDG